MSDGVRVRSAGLPARAGASRAPGGLRVRRSESGRMLRAFVALALALTLAGCGGDGGGGSNGSEAAVNWVRHWNEVAIEASGLDHTPVQPGENRVFGENIGPGRSSRAIAIVPQWRSCDVAVRSRGRRSLSGTR